MRRRDGFWSTGFTLAGGWAVGDRVRVRNNNQIGRAQRRGSLNSGGAMPQGVVMYMGPCGFAEGRTMVGLRMDDRPMGGGHDGKEKGSRPRRGGGGRPRASRRLFASHSAPPLAPPSLASVAPSRFS
jgi:hypothetical protein